MKRLTKKAGLTIKTNELQGIDNEIMEGLIIKPQSIDGYVDLHDCDITITMNNGDIIKYTYNDPDGEAAGEDNSITNVTINGQTMDVNGEGILEVLTQAYKNYLKK